MGEVKMAYELGYKLFLPKLKELTAALKEGQLDKATNIVESIPRKPGDHENKTLCLDQLKIALIKGKDRITQYGTRSFSVKLFFDKYAADTRDKIAKKVSVSVPTPLPASSSPFSSLNAVSSSSSSPVSSSSSGPLITRDWRIYLSQKERERVAVRQNMECNICRNSFLNVAWPNSPMIFEVDHVIPLRDFVQANGNGKSQDDLNSVKSVANDPDNLQALCLECHKRKTEYEQTPHADWFGYQETVLADLQKENQELNMQLLKANQENSELKELAKCLESN